MASAYNNIMVKSAPLNFDQSLRTSNRFLWEENVHQRCPGTLDASSNSWVASAQCSKGANSIKHGAQKNATYPSEGLIHKGL